MISVYSTGWSQLFLSANWGNKSTFHCQPQLVKTLFLWHNKKSSSSIRHAECFWTCNAVPLITGSTVEMRGKWHTLSALPCYLALLHEWEEVVVLKRLHQLGVFQWHSNWLLIPSLLHNLLLSFTHKFFGFITGKLLFVQVNISVVCLYF